jgi:hypothetical protein
MSNYTKLTSYDTKDALSTGDPLKRVKGTELDDEFDAISTAIATKADSASPSFSGTPTAPTASYGTNTTQLATTAFVKAALAAMYPVGSVYTNISDSTNPATLLGFGTWVAITGRVVVGLDSGDAAFDTAGETGGSKDAIVVSHTHSVTDPGHTHNYTKLSLISGTSSGPDANWWSASTQATSSATTGISIASAGSSGTNANLQPYVVAYVWKRTA